MADQQVQPCQGVHQILRREYGLARIHEINDTPVLTAGDAPVAPPCVPATTSSRSLSTRLVRRVGGGHRKERRALPQRTDQ